MITFSSTDDSTDAKIQHTAKPFYGESYPKADKLFFFLYLAGYSSSVRILYSTVVLITE